MSTWESVISTFGAALLGIAWAAGGAAQGDPYALDTCPVTGKKLGASPVVREYDGREVRFCGDECPAKFEEDKAGYWKKIDEAVVKQQTPLYPLETCVVSGGKLGEMGAPVDHVYRNRLVRFCCAGCIATFEKDPASHLAKLDAAAVEKQKASYPLKTCVVSGSKLGEMGEPVDLVVAGRLVRLCCKGCVGKVRKDPLKYLDMIDKGAERPPKEEEAPPKDDGGGHRHH